MPAAPNLQHPWPKVLSVGAYILLCCLQGHRGHRFQGCVNLTRFIRPSSYWALQVEQSDGQIESLALSDELDTADKRSSALAGKRCWQGCCLCCMPNGVTHKWSRSLPTADQLQEHWLMQIGHLEDVNTEITLTGHRD